MKKIKVIIGGHNMELCNKCDEKLQENLVLDNSELCEECREKIDEIIKPKIQKILAEVF